MHTLDISTFETYMVFRNLIGLEAKQKLPLVWWHGLQAVGKCTIYGAEV